MPRNEYRIPRKDDLFHAYIMTTAKALMEGSPVPTWQRLGLTPDEKQQWLNLDGLWQARYSECNNPGIRTTAITNEKNKVRKQFIVFANPLLVRMAGSPNITFADRSTFRLALPDRTLTARGAINETVVAILTPAGGARIKVRVRTSSDSNRASRHKLSDGVEVRYMVGNSQPHSVEQCITYYISTRALFTLQLDFAAQGQKIFCYFRWVNFSRPQNSGPWSGLYQCIVA